MCDSDATTIKYKMTSIGAEEMYVGSISTLSGFNTPPQRDDSDSELDIEVNIVNATPFIYGHSVSQNLHARVPSSSALRLIFPYREDEELDFPAFPDFSDILDKEEPICAEFTITDGPPETETPREDNLFWFGKYQLEDGVCYNGDIVNGLRQGFGTLTRPDGYSYRGIWANDKRHGEGHETLPDGSNYDGDWYNDEKSGWGVSTYLDGTEHKGDWKGGVKNGWGRIVYGEDNDKLKGRIYSGQWRMDGDNLQGKGEILYPNGDTYTGEWVNEARHGRGIHKASDGTNCIGTWENDEAIFGDIIYPDGTNSTGIRWKSVARIMQAL
jgi:hypothetical protein